MTTEPDITGQEADLAISPLSQDELDEYTKQNSIFIFNISAHIPLICRDLGIPFPGITWPRKLGPHKL